MFADSTRFRRFCLFASLCFTILAVSSCGRMSIKETHYYAVQRDDNVNVFRLKVTGKTVLSDAKYQSGWFPSNAVDSLYGNVTSDGAAKELEARREIEAEVRKAVLAATKAYSKVALDPNATDEQIQQQMTVRRRVLAYPSLDKAVSDSDVYIDYDPSKGVVSKHADEKMVFILSANPDAVVGNIKNFAESDKTSLAVSNLAKVTSQRIRNEVAAEEAVETIDKQAILNQINESIELLSAPGNLNSKDQITEYMQILLAFLEGVE